MADGGGGGNGGGTQWPCAKLRRVRWDLRYMNTSASHDTSLAVSQFSAMASRELRREKRHRTNGRLSGTGSTSHVNVHSAASPLMAPSSVASSVNGSPPPSPGGGPLSGRFSMGSLLLARKGTRSPGRKSSSNSLKRASLGSVLRARFHLGSGSSARSASQPNETPPASLFGTETFSSHAYDDETMSGMSERDYVADVELEDDDDDDGRTGGAYIEDDDVSDSDESLLRFEEGPLDLRYETLAGQKHVYPGGITMNEDNASTFDLHVGNRWARCFYIADGHGEVIDKRMVRPGYVSYGRHFVDLLDQVLPDVVQSILETETISITENGDEDVARRVTTALGELHLRLNEAIADLDPDVCAENGSTLCLGIIYRGHLFCCSIGDSSMFMADQDGLPMRVWCRRGKDNVLSVCSFEDTLDMYPVKLRQGQNLRALRRDYTELQGRVKPVREMGCNVYLVVSDRSSYALRMTNTLGNFNHSGWTLSRTNVYSLPLARLPPNTTLMFVTDGIKDLMDVEELSRFSTSIRNGVIPPEYQTITTRRRWRSRDPAAELDRFLAPRREYIPPPQFHAYRTRLLDLLRRDIKRPLDTPPQLSDVCTAIILSALVRYATDDLTVLAVRLPGRGSADAVMRSVRPRPHSWQEHRASMNSRPASIASASSYGAGSMYAHATDAELAELSPAEALRRRKRESAPADLFRGVHPHLPSGDESDSAMNGASSVISDLDAQRSRSGSPPSPYLEANSAPGSPASMAPTTVTLASASPIPTPSMTAATAARLAAVTRSNAVRPRTQSTYIAESADADGYLSAASNSSAPADMARRRKRTRSLIFKTPSLRTLRNLFRKPRDGNEDAESTTTTATITSSPLRMACHLDTARRSLGQVGVRPYAHLLPWSSRSHTWLRRMDSRPLPLSTAGRFCRTHVISLRAPIVWTFSTPAPL
ncbi:hypothetical protein THASP1DRAFT_22339 [Thamnocephalis sphaerospora]|uniref:PPM-type phosphatase domain-containing protein n=1 Tax=Thamnocephalis sphaerospora TaxID=78915 RepID=A0A4P9XV58_9FUNG|nr:hypothetical protein THASP1DRAFT_22339 [Thamnocephalis sphaerospora]|eukprot:RKP09882.1 hypothetical protein THASP1DRAFT_22339 [Thamnocephalis sphaerospora]